MRRAWKPDYHQLELLAANRHSVKEMCALLGCCEKTFFNYQKKHPRFRDTLERGRARAVSICATTLLAAAQGTLADDTDDKGNQVKAKVWGKKQEIQVKAALEYLGRHGDDWKPAPVIKHEIGGQIDNHVKLDVALDEHTCMRMSAAFLKTRGISVEDIPGA